MPSFSFALPAPVAALPARASALVAALPASARWALAGAGAAAVLVALIKLDRGAAAMSAEQQALVGAAAPRDVEVPLAPVAGGGAAHATISRVTSAARAAEVLSALHPDAMLRACFRELPEGAHSEQRKRSLQWVHNAALEMIVPAQSGAICLQATVKPAAAAAGPDAVAVWWPRGTELPAILLLLNGGWQFSFRYSGWERRGRLALWSQAVQPRRRRLMEDARGNFYYLMTAAAREGLAPQRAAVALRAVLLPVLRRADATGAACYVECTDVTAAAATDAAPSLGLLDTYLALGFREIEDFTFFGVEVRCLRREAGAIMSALATAA